MTGSGEGEGERVGRLAPGEPADPGGPADAAADTAADAAAEPGADPAAGPAAGPERLSRRAVVLLVGAFLGIAVAAVVSMVPVHYAVLEPGPISNTLGAGADGKPLISITGAAVYPTSGALNFTTVRVTGGPGDRPTALMVIRAWFDPHAAVLDEDQLFPKGVTGKQVEQENTAEMAGSQQDAIAVALRALGKAVPETVLVAAVPAGSPSAGVLKPGDEIVSVDGHRVTSAQDVRTDVQARRPVESVTLGVRRAGAALTLKVTAGRSDGHAAVGIYLRSTFHFPVTVRINAGDVGGPSAGTMFALGIYDKLTPGALTGGADIAGTGTIDTDGTVGPIGGIQEKLAGAQEGGAQWFLAPAGNCGEVVGHVPDGLRVVKIATFEQARRAVEAIGGKHTGSLPTCTK